jgi:PAS domain S-box-containing protein
MKDILKAGIDRILRFAGGQRPPYVVAVIAFLAMAALCGLLSWYPRSSILGILILTGLIEFYFCKFVHHNEDADNLLLQLSDVNRQLSKEIAERKQVEATLSVTEIKQKALYDLSADAIVLMDLEKGVVSGNPACWALFGCKNEEEFSQKMYEMWSPKLQPDGVPSRVKAKKMVAMVLKEGTYSFEWKYQRANGEEFLANVSLVKMDLEGRTFLQATLHDITEQRWTQEELLKSDRRFMDVLYASSDAMLLIDNGKFVDCNDAAVRMLRYPNKEAFSMSSPWDISPPVQPDGRSSMEKAVEMEDAAIQHGTHRFEWILQKADGETFPVEVTLTAIIAQGKNQILCVWRDITEQKRAQKALEDSERRLATIIDLLPDATFAIDREGHVIAWNHAIEKITGVPASEMLGKGDYAYAVPLYGKPQPMVINMVLGGHDERWKDYDFVDREGTHVIAQRFVPGLRGGQGAYVWGVVAPLSDSEGNIIGAIESFRDITEQKQAQKALEESERRLARIINFLPDGTFAIDRDRRVIAWNHALEEMTGVPASEMLGKGDYAYAVPFYGKAEPILIDLIFENNEEQWEKYSSIERKGDQLIAERFIPNLYGGKGAYIAGSAAPLYDGEGNIAGAITMIRDVTERKKAEDALRTSETKYRTVYDASLDGILVRKPDRSILAANRAAVAMFGYKDESELLALPLKDLYPEYQPDGSLSTEKAMRMLDIAMREGATFFEWQYYRKGGDSFFAMVGLTTMNLDGKLFLLNTIRDITKQKQAEEALRASETKYKTLYDASADAIRLRTADRRIIAGNRAAIAMFGCKDEKELTALTPTDIYPENQPNGRPSSEEAAKAMDCAIREGSVFLEWRYKRTDGTEFDALVSLTAMDIEGECCILTTARDITEQKRAEEAVHASETKYRTLFDASSDAILLRTLDRRIIGANRAAVMLFGCKDEAELLAMTPTDLYPEYQPDGQLSLEKAPKMVDDALQSGFYYFEWQYKRKNGTEFLANVLWTKMEVEGKLILLTTIRDITEQRRAEEALRTSERKLRLFADNVYDVIWAIDFSGRFTYVSSSVNLLLGYTPDELMHFKIDSVLTPESTALAYRHLEQALAAAQSGQRAAGKILELEQVRKDGSTVMTEVSYSGMYDESGQIVAFQGISRDITDRKQAEINLAQARDEAQAANLAKSQFLATMSHEIRTPMTAILGYADLLMDPTIDASSRNNYATTIRRSGEHLLTLINDILDLSKIEAGKMTLDLGPCHLVALLADIASLFQPRSKEHGISFSLEFQGPLPETIHTDGARLRQALINLTGNAIKFTEKGSAKIVTSFLPDGDQGQPAVRIDVVDTGIGISQETLKKLFLPFSQGDPLTTKKYGGTGLGLAISYHIAKMLGGSLTVRSKFGQGSTFTLTIPTGNLDGVAMLQNPAEASQMEVGKGWISGSEELTGVRILLAEDGLDNRELIQAILSRVGADVDTAENGRIAVEKACNQSFDLILMDMNMPEMDGYEATGVLRSRGYRGPIVALTANAMVGDSERCKIAGCNEYLTKPINRSHLIQTIIAFVDLKAAAARVPATAQVKKSSSCETESSKAGHVMGVSADHVAVDSDVTLHSNLQPTNILSPGESLAATDGEEVLVSEFVNDPDVSPLIEKFTERLAEQLNAMYRAVASHEHDELRRLAHKLKGAGGSYGYPQLTVVCKALEDAAHAANDPEEIVALDQVAALVHAIKNACPSP